MVVVIEKLQREEIREKGQISVALYHSFVTPTHNSQLSTLHDRHDTCTYTTLHPTQHTTAIDSDLLRTYYAILACHRFRRRLFVN
ncbi:hypothetical protein TMatcc_008083 [Talaromyces marneffei ATCC 18224]